MTARTRADLEQLPNYVPGRTIAGAIKLASNEVAAGPVPRAAGRPTSPPEETAGSRGMRASRGAPISWARSVRRSRAVRRLPRER